MSEDALFGESRLYVVIYATVFLLYSSRDINIMVSKIRYSAYEYYRWWRPCVGDEGRYSNLMGDYIAQTFTVNLYMIHVQSIEYLIRHVLHA